MCPPKGVIELAKGSSIVGKGSFVKAVMKYVKAKGNFEFAKGRFVNAETNYVKDIENFESANGSFNKDGDNFEVAAEYLNFE